MNSSLKMQYEWMQSNSGVASITLVPIAIVSNLWFDSTLLFIFLSALGGVGSYLHWRSIYLDRELSLFAYSLAIGAPILAGNVYGDRGLVATISSCFALYLLALFALLFANRPAADSELHPLQASDPDRRGDHGEA